MTPLSPKDKAPPLTSEQLVDLALILMRHERSSNAYLSSTLSLVAKERAVELDRAGTEDGGDMPHPFTPGEHVLGSGQMRCAICGGLRQSTKHLQPTPTAPAAPAPQSMDETTARNKRVRDRWDELMREGKHGYYETLFRVVREEVEAAHAAGLAERVPEEMPKWFPGAINWPEHDARNIYGIVVGAIGAIPPRLAAKEGP